MEIKFNKVPVHCIRPVLTQVQSCEQTQEVKLPDGLPDIGRILGCWGQVIIRGKEWRRTSMSANGGVMAWVMYVPEDGTQPRVLDAWLPFQTRWELPESVEDGTMTVMPQLTEINGRNVSARKIILRAGVSLLGAAMEDTKQEIATPSDQPEDVQLLVKTYPAELPIEAGERLIQIEENMTLPSDKHAIDKIVCYELIPSVQEQKVLANRLVFRGKCIFRLVYLGEDGAVNQWQYEIPFSDFTELRYDHDTTATAWILPILTALEFDRQEDGQMQLRAGLAAQYTIFDRAVMRIAEDAYSPYRDVELQTELLKLPVLLDRRELEMPVTAHLNENTQQILDHSPRCAHPMLSANENGMCMKLSGQCQLLYRNGECELATDTVRYGIDIPFDSADNNDVQLWPGCLIAGDCTQGTSEITMRANLPVTAFTFAADAIQMVTGIEIGERKQPNPDRPSLILKRAGQEDLWSLAKKYGSTVDAIMTANHLTEEPAEGEMLLVPVY